MGLLTSYDNEFAELYEFLAGREDMVGDVAIAFLIQYDRPAGKKLVRWKEQITAPTKSPDPETRLTSKSIGEDPRAYAVTEQAYEAYMADPRRARHTGGHVELAIWAILLNNSQILEQMDKPFSEWVSKNYKLYVPDVFEKAFGTD